MSSVSEVLKLLLRVKYLRQHSEFNLDLLLSDINNYKLAWSDFTICSAYDTFCPKTYEPDKENIPNDTL